MEQQEKKLYRCGTLTYTKLGLVNLAIWLLWGDFSLILLNNVFPALTPLQLNLHNASNATIGLLMGTIPSIITFIANPIISTSSDRTRSRWGRRIPYLLFTAPFTAAFMIMLGWSDKISEFFMKLVSFNGDPSLFIIVVMSICVVGYSIFQMFSDSVFWYIFADVVPDQFMGRFMAAFRVIGAVGGMVGEMMNDAMGAAMNPSTPAPTSQPAQAFCDNCGAKLNQGSAFCEECGTPVMKSNKTCINCGYEFERPGKFCPKCGTKREG